MGENQLLDFLKVGSQLAATSPAIISILKKIPFFRQYIINAEYIEKMNDANDQKRVNDYKLLNDPDYQLKFINSINEPELKKAMIGNIIKAQNENQESINIVFILSEFYNDIVSSKKIDVDDKKLHPDWWLLWVKNAQMSSDPEKQEIWAKLLRSEAEKQGSVSPRLIRIIADLSFHELNLFKKVMKFYTQQGLLICGVGNNSYTRLSLKKEYPQYDFAEVLLLENTSLLNINGDLGITYVHEKAQNNDFYLNFLKNKIRINYNAKKLTFSYSSNLSPEGVMLRDMLLENDDMEIVKNISNIISKQLKCKTMIEKL